MKTAISLPDHLFERVERTVARERMTRSEFFAKAAERYLVELDRANLTERMNAALELVGDSYDEEQREWLEFNKRQLAKLTEDDEW